MVLNIISPPLLKSKRLDLLGLPLILVLLQIKFNPSFQSPFGISLLNHITQSLIVALLKVNSLAYQE